MRASADTQAACWRSARASTDEALSGRSAATVSGVGGDASVAASTALGVGAGAGAGGEEKSAERTPLLASDGGGSSAALAADS